MNINDVVPTSALVKRFGVKAVVYSGPGMGKTPMMLSAPNPITCFCETGLLSVRHSQAPAFLALTYKDIREFWLWAIGSHEAQQFETKCCDSISQMAEIILAEEFAMQASGKNKNSDPRNAYGEMAKKMMEIMNWIYYAPNFNALLIAKEGMREIDGMDTACPYFPGQDINIKIPHLFDSVWRIETVKDKAGQAQKVIRTQKSFNAFARDRSGNLAVLEPADIKYLFDKSRL